VQLHFIYWQCNFYLWIILWTPIYEPFTTLMQHLRAPFNTSSK
jgi:hypothetical protein